LLSREENGNAPAPRSAAVIYPNAKKILKRTLFYIVLTYQKPVLFSYIYPSTFKAKMIRPSNRASIRNISDYSPFGVLLPGRHSVISEYRYGLNGMEKDDEIKNIEGSSYDFGARLYDPRVARWLTQDALSIKKPDLSPYQAFKNNPVVYVDPDGNDEYFYNN
jgi:RHS repeat-associated protein